ncbi:hypothetical protein Bca4012_054613 [Brassica carinata]
MFYYMIFLPLALFLVAYKLISTSKKQRFNLPPSPPYALPILGHHLLIKPPVHRLFHRLSETYGPIFSLRVGYRRTVVISSSSLASECFTGQNDILLSNRPCFLTAKYVAYNYTTVGTAPYGDHWRNLRRVCSLEILSSNRLTNFLHIRKDEIRRMLTRLTREVNKEIELEPLLSDLTFNNIVRMVTGKRYYGDEVHNEEEANLFKKLVADVNDCSGARHPGDYLPFFKIFGGTFEKKVKAVGEAMDEILQRLLDECRADKDGNTMVNHLLSLQEQEPDYYTDVTIKGLMLVSVKESVTMGMMIAGTDTSAVTLEWAMACLLRHPESLEKARLEIEDKIGQERLIDEPDLANLPYLQNIVSETFRLYPAAPLLVPRSTTEDIKVGGYDVPRGTMVMVNAWAIHRDPILWNEPEKFKPERFNDEDVHKLMSFGNGRRACPGAGLGQRIVTLALGSLIQCFDWKKVNGEKIDMTETSGMAMHLDDRLLLPPRSSSTTTANSTNATWSVPSPSSLKTLEFELLSLHTLDFEDGEEEVFIRCFDYSDEIFKDICICPPNSYGDNSHLASFNGDSLSLLQQDQATRNIEVWVSSKLSDGDVSFSKYFSLSGSVLPAIWVDADAASPVYCFVKPRSVIVWCVGVEREGHKYS